VFGRNDAHRIIQKPLSYNTNTMKETSWKATIFTILQAKFELKKKHGGKIVFSLSEIYEKEQEMKTLHPHNKNIKAKVRQVLQQMRDK
jgi:hypothetical protein